MVSEGVDNVHGLAYWQKGWTSFEFALANILKGANTSVDWPLVLDLGKKGKEQVAFVRPVPVEPLAFFVEHSHGDLVTEP